MDRRLIAQNPSETFSSLTFSIAPVSNSFQGNDRFGLDNLTLATLAQVQTSATAVPEPFTIIGTTLGIVSAFQMRKKLKSENKLSTSRSTLPISNTITIDGVFLVLLAIEYPG